MVLAAAFAADLLIGFGWVGLAIALVAVGIGSFIGYWKSDAIASSHVMTRPM